MSAEISSLEKIILQANDTPDGWRDLCDALAQCAGGVGTALLSINPAERGHGIVASRSLDAVTAAYVEGGWYLEDHRQAAIPKMLERGYCSDADVDTFEVLRKQPFYTGLLQRYDLGGFCGIHFQVGDRDWCASIQFGTSRFEPREGFIEHIDSIRSKLTEVATLSMLQAEDYWRHLRNTYRQVGCELVPLDAYGEVITVHISDADADFGRIEDDQSWAAPIKNGASIVHLVDGETKQWLTSPDALPPPNMTTELNGAFLSCVYLNAPAPTKFFAFGVSGILCLSRVSGRTNPAQDFAKRINLTPAETRVVEALAVGDDTKKIAQKLGLTDGTVRQYLKSVFRKADVKSQHQLVAAVYSGAR